MGIITSMRNRMQVVMWTILVLFVTSMAIGGLVGGASITDIFGQRQGNEVGSINGEPILFEDFNQLVSNEINRLDSQSGKPVSDEEREYVRAVVWERLIADLIIQEQIEKNKIVVGEEEVLFQMKNNPPPFLQNSEAFQSFGRFDLEKYLNAVLTPDQIDWKPIEDFMQNVYLPNYKLQQYVINASAIHADEVLKDYKKRFVNHKLEILHITDKAIDNDFYNSMIQNRPTDDELLDLYNKNVSNYDQPETRFMQYVKWPIVSDANDTLRVKLEAENLIYRIEGSLLYYGNEFTLENNPLECWFDNYCRNLSHDFIGKDALNKILKNGVEKKLKGITFDGSPTPPCSIPFPVYSKNRFQIGNITSGIYSPFLKTNIGLSMVDRDYWNDGQDVIVLTPDNIERKGKVCSLPFNYS